MPWIISIVPIAYEISLLTTHLTARGDTKIFEGDIVKVDDDFETFGKMAGEIRGKSQGLARRVYFQAVRSWWARSNKPRDNRANSESVSSGTKCIFDVR